MSYNTPAPEWLRRGPPSSGAPGYGQPPPPPGGPPAAGRGSGSLGGQVSFDLIRNLDHPLPGIQLPPFLARVDVDRMSVLILVAKILLVNTTVRTSTAVGYPPPTCGLTRGFFASETIPPLYLLLLL